MSKNHQLIDLFSGCGGFSLGSHLAGFTTAVAVDIDTTLSSSYKMNFRSANLLNADIGKLDSDVLIKNLDGTRAAGIVGGPPCQGFSLMGRRDASDPRNNLVRHFFRHVSAVKPKFFVMENVPGIVMGDAYKTLKSAVSSLRGNYKVLDPIRVDAAAFGAATRRQRILVIGYDPDAMDEITEDYILDTKGFKRANVRDAINDLPSPISISKENDFDWSNYTPGVNHYARKASKLPSKELGSESARLNLKNKRVSGCLSTTHSNAVEKRYKSVEPGSTDKISRSTRLSWEGVSTTLRAGTGNERGSYQAVRPIHPDEPRVITVREAARLQGFPDWFVFHPTKWHSFRMIGNSVSPYVSEGIMNKISKKLVTA